MLRLSINLKKEAVLKQGRDLSLKSLIRVNAIFYLSFFILIVSVSAIYFYEQQKQRVQERIIQTGQRIEGLLSNEVRIIENQLLIRRDVARVLELDRPLKEKYEIVSKAAVDSLTTSRLQYNIYMAFEETYSRKHFGKKSFAAGLHRDPKLIGQPSYYDPSTFQPTSFETSVYQTSPSEVWYQVAKRSQHIEWTDVYFDQTYMKRWMISVGLGLYSRENEFQGMVGTDILLDDLTQFVEHFSVGQAGGVVLVDMNSYRILSRPEGEAGEIIQVNDKYEVPGAGSQLYELLKLISSDGESVKRFHGDNGKLYLISIHVSKALPWAVISFQAFDEAYTPVLRHVLLLAFVAALGLTLLFILSRQFSASVSLPLKQLIDSLDANIRSAQRDEIMKVNVQTEGYLEVKKVSELVNRLVEVVNSRMTEHLRLVEEQRAKAVHSARMASVGQLAGNVAHEINNPLAAISLNSEVLQAEIERTPGLSANFLLRVRNIRRLTDRIAQTVKGFLSLSREGKSVPLQRVHLNEIIQDTLNICQGKFRDQGVDLRVDPVPDVHLYCRSVQISQVLLNLLNNSFDAIAENEEKWIHISFIDFENYVVIRVTDSGMGIPSEVVQRMMEPFYTTKEVNRGTGLGLSISKTIIDEHRGRLYYDASSSHTSFVIELPKS